MSELGVRANTVVPIGPVIIRQCTQLRNFRLVPPKKIAGHQE